MAYKMIQVGTGGHGAVWCKKYLPPNIKDGLIDVVAAVDKNLKALNNAQKYLGLDSNKCYTDVQKAFEENDADFCSIVIPPTFHEELIDLALKYDMHVLSEKPIADTLEASVRIAKKIRKAEKKMGITMSHRFDQDKTTLRKIIASGKYGSVDYIVCRCLCNNRIFGNWGEYRHTMADPLLTEGASHRLDIIADLAQSKCKSVYAQSWNPSWGEYKGDSQALVTLVFENGVRAIYEGAKSNAASLNPPGNEYFRLECEKATVILNQRKIEHFKFEPSHSSLVREGQGNKISLIKQKKWSNTWLIEKFINWLNGGSPMETEIDENLQSMAINFAAIESSKTGKPIEVKDFLKKVTNQSIID